MVSNANLTLFLQNGHYGCTISHSSMQSPWNACLQTGNYTTISSDLNSSKQIEHC